MRLPEELLISRCVETDHQRSSRSQCWGTEIARGTQKQAGEGFLVQLFLPQVEVNDVLTLTRVDFVNVLKKG